MASNYWDSTQAKFWTFSRQALADMQKDLEKANPKLHEKYPLPDRRLMNIYYQQHLTKLARRMSLRQQPLATAQSYIKRFYARVEVRKTNPYLIMATAIYLACKMEECPQHIRLVLSETVRTWSDLGFSESSKIGECEFAMISTLSSRLICHHPYRTLMELSPIFGLTNDETHLAHTIINDSYNTDLILIYPPSIIAITAVFLAVVLRPSGQSAGNQVSSYHGSPSQSHGGQAPGYSIPGSSPTISSNAAQQAFLGGLSGLKQSGPKLGKLVDWLAESKIDMNTIVDATQELISLYDVWESYNERTCRDSIAKFMKDPAAAMGPK